MIGFVQKWLRRVFYISESADAFDTNSTIWIKRKLSLAKQQVSKNLKLKFLISLLRISIFSPTKHFILVITLKMILKEA